MSITMTFLYASRNRTVYINISVMKASAFECTYKHTGDRPQKSCALDPISINAHASMRIT